MEKHKNTFVITVKAVVINNDGKVLVLKRPEHEKSGAGKYDLPGGSIEQGEDIKAALNREIKEETELEAQIGPVIHVFDFEKGEGNEPESTTVGKGIRFLAYYKNGEVKLDEKEHAEFEWLEIDKAIEKFEDKGFEKDKRDSLIKAKEYLELKNSLDSWKRCAADFENYKKRQAETQKDFIRFSTESVMLQLLPVIDNFHASTDHIPSEQKEAPWVIGIMYIQKQLESILTTYGVSEIETKVGDEFNPEIHEAVIGTEHGAKSTEQGAQSIEHKNKIAKIIQKGYKMDNKIIRPARVIVD